MGERGKYILVETGLGREEVWDVEQWEGGQSGGE